MVRLGPLSGSLPSRASGPIWNGRERGGCRSSNRPCESPRQNFKSHRGWCPMPFVGAGGPWSGAWVRRCSAPGYESFFGWRIHVLGSERSDILATFHIDKSSRQSQAGENGVRRRNVRRNLESESVSHAFG